MEVYSAFGLTIHSGVPLPELERPDNRAAAPDAVIMQAAPDGPAFLPASSRSLTVTEGIVAFRVPETAEFRIMGGRRIEYRPEPGADMNKIRLYLLGTCMGALLLQRQVLPLHGSVIEIGGRAYAVVGESGAGKSTVTSVLLGKGCRLLTDDVAAIMFGDDGRPLAMPSYPQQKLWQESLSRLGMTSADYRPLFERETKFAVPAVSRFCNQPKPLAGVFELVKTASPSVEAAELSGLERLHMLYTHTFRRSLLEPLGLMGWHFETAARLSGTVRMMRLGRPATGFSAQQLAENLLSYAKEDEDNEHDRALIHRLA